MIGIGRLTEAQEEILYMELINSNSKLEKRKNAITEVKLTEDLYPKIKEIAEKEKSMAGIYTLSKYKKEEDKKFIIDSMNIFIKKGKNTLQEKGYGYQTIKELPSKEFFPFLEKELKLSFSQTKENAYYCILLYDAIIAYKNKESLNLLESIYKKENYEKIAKEHTYTLYEALNKNKDEIYDPLYWKIWEAEEEISIENYRMLYSKDKIQEGYYKNRRSSYFQSKERRKPFYKKDTGKNIPKEMSDVIFENGYEYGVKVIQDNHSRRKFR